jgi:hypothetical protein
MITRIDLRGQKEQQYANDDSENMNVQCKQLRTQINM